MTRISLKEQYDNSSVIKQIADLTDQIDGYDEEIEQAVTTANEASSVASSAKSVADAAAAKNTEQDSRLDAIESTDTAQEQEIAGIKLKDTQQDASISAIEAKDTEQDSRLTAIEAKDTEQDAKIATIQAKDAEQDLSISTILDTDTKQDAAISALQTITNTLTNEVINSVSVTDGTQNGAIMVRLTDVGGRVISSPNYPWGQVATFALKQGAQAGYVYGELTLSDGEVIKSNDYQILQVIESDVYVTSITLTPYPTTGKLGGEIGYSNGNTAQINVIDVPTAPGVTSSINDLLSRMGVAEASINELDTRVKAIEDTPGVGAFTNTSRGTILGSTEDGKVSANDDGTGSVSGWSSVAKSADVEATYAKSADVAATYATKTALASTDAAVSECASGIAANRALISPCIDDVNISGSHLVFDKVNGEQKEIELPSGGDEWEEVSLTNFPADWVVGTRVRVYFKEISIIPPTAPTSWTQSFSGTPTYSFSDSKVLPHIEYELTSKNENSNPGTPIIFKLHNKGYYALVAELSVIGAVSEYNSVGSWGILNLFLVCFNGSSSIYTTLKIARGSVSQYIAKIERKIPTT